MKKIACTLSLFILIILTAAACGKGGTSAEKVMEIPSRGPDLPLKVLMETRVIKGYDEKSTPDEFDRVGYNRYYLKGQSGGNIPVLIIVSGYVADTSWFNRMAWDLVLRKNLEVWTINRREALIEERNKLNRDISDFISFPGKRKGILRRMNRTSNYLRGKDSYIKNWGFRVFMNDIMAVVKEAGKQSSSLFLGGWSDGVEYCMLFANYRFTSGFGARSLKGLVFFDENPEWGKLSGKQEELQKHIDRQAKLMDQGHIYMKYYPSLAVHTLALELASRFPDKQSPLAEAFRLPDSVKNGGITNRGLIGWLYDQDVDGYSKRIRGPFAYLVRSGNLSVPGNEPGENEQTGEGKKNTEGAGIKRKGKKNTGGEDQLSRWVSYRESGEKSDINLLIREYQSAGRLWEYFYPRKVLKDYFELGLCDFECADFNVHVNRKNMLPIYYILTGTNNVGKGFPSGLTWYFGKSGIIPGRVTFNKLYDYAHADMFFAHDAPKKLYGPLHNWLVKTSGGGKTGKDMEAKR